MKTYDGGTRREQAVDAFAGWLACFAFQKYLGFTPSGYRRAVAGGSGG
jgi:hypothetical protein